MDNVRRRQGGSNAAAAASPTKEGSNGVMIKEQQEMMNNGNGKNKPASADTPLWVYALLVLFAVITFVTYPVPFQPHGDPKLKHVFFYGWMTAISTGCGVLPFMVLPDVPKFWVGISNGTSFFLTLGGRKQFYSVTCRKGNGRIDLSASRMSRHLSHIFIMLLHYLLHLLPWSV